MSRNYDITACKLSHTQELLKETQELLKDAEELLEDIKAIIVNGEYSPGETPEDESFLVLNECDAECIEEDIISFLKKIQ